MEDAAAPARKVMVIADPTRESAAALQWTLSHALMEQDELILLHVENPSSWKTTLSPFRRKSNPQTAAPAIPPPSLSASSPAPMTLSSLLYPDGDGGWDPEFLEEMKHACEAAQPKARVHVERTEIMGGNDKAGTILFRSVALSVDLLVIGQRRSLSTAILGSRLNGGVSMKGTRSGADAAEFLIENSICTCVGVQKKGHKGGYLLNTKTHKNFWLLA